MRYISTKEQRRAKLSQFVYVMLNIALAVMVLLSVSIFNTPILALFFVVVSKWRVFAVKPRFWWVNIRSNLIDFVVGLGFIAWLVQVGNNNLQTQIFLTLAYIVWLLFIKPRSSRKFIIAQALISMYVGLSALAVVGYDWDVLGIVLCSAIIGFNASHHILGDYDLGQTNRVTLAWALVVAELSWVYYHWTITYPISVLSGFRFVQPAIAMTLLTFLAWKVFDLLHQTENSTDSKKPDLTELKLPVIFTVAIIVIMLIFFSKTLSGNI